MTNAGIKLSVSNRYEVIRRGQTVSITAPIIHRSVLENRTVVAIIPRAKICLHEASTYDGWVGGPKTCDRSNVLRNCLGYMQNRVYNLGINRSGNRP